jgi:hypothetical protein
MIIQDIDTIGTFVVEFLLRSRRLWCAREQIGPITTSIDSVCIEVLEENETKEQHFMDA